MRTFYRNTFLVVLAILILIKATPITIKAFVTMFPSGGVLGMDISKYQGNIDFNKAKQAGIKFAIIRAGYGVEPRPDEVDRRGKPLDQVDPMFYDNVIKAKQCGLPIGAYHYTYAKNVEEAVREAQFFIKILSCENIPSCKSLINPTTKQPKIKQKIQFEYPVAIDVEDPTLRSVDKETLTKAVSAFCDTMHSAGYHIIVYSSQYFMDKYLFMDKINCDGIWLASWKKEPHKHNCSCFCSIWQFCSDGQAGNFGANSKYIDLNICYADYISIIKNRGGNPNR